MVLVDPGACWAACALLTLSAHRPPATSTPLLSDPAAGLPLACACQADDAVRAHGLLTLRPAVAADGPAQRALCDALAPADLALFGAGALSPAVLAACIAGEPVGGIGLVALRGEGADAELVGLARLAADPDGIAGEFAILVHPSARRRGLGRQLVERLLADSRRRGLLLVRTAALPRNTAMLALARGCGFQLLPAADGTIELVMALSAGGAGGAARMVRR